MSSYLVLKRLAAADGQHFPGEVLVDPDNAGILMERRFIQVVPDDFKPATARSRAPERAGSGARQPSTKGKAAVSIGEAPARPEPPTTTTPEPPPLPTVEEALEAGYSQEGAEALAAGEEATDEQKQLVESETKALEEALTARPEILKLAAATEEKVSSLLELSDDDYKELVRTFLTEPGAGTVGAAVDD